MKIRSVALVLTVGLIVVACSGPSERTSTPATRDTLVANHDMLGTVGSADADTPGFFLTPDTRRSVIEYARTAIQSSKPIRTVKVRGVFFGADRKGQLYSYSAGTPPQTCGVCKVFVQSVTGQLEYTLTLSTELGASSPVNYFVDAAGSVYDVNSGCTTIAQFAPGAHGEGVQPIRTIDIPRQACGQNAVRVGPAQFTVFADAKGGVYYRGNNRAAKGYAWYIWAPGASGKKSPAREIYGPTFNSAYGFKGVQGVDGDGNIWTFGTFQPPTAYEYTPSARGNAKPVVVPLEGSQEINGLVVALNGRLAYTGSGPKGGNAGVLKVAPAGSRPTRTLTLPRVKKLYLFTAL